MPVSPLNVSSAETLLADDACSRPSCGEAYSPDSSTSTPLRSAGLLMFGRRSRAVSLPGGGMLSSAAAASTLTKVSSGSTSREACQRRKPRNPAISASSANGRYQNCFRASNSPARNEGSSTGGSTTADRDGAGGVAAIGSSTIALLSVGAGMSSASRGAVGPTAVSPVAESTATVASVAGAGATGSGTGLPVARASRACNCASSVLRSASSRCDSANSLSSCARRCWVAASPPPLPGAPAPASDGATSRRRPAPPVSAASGDRASHAARWRRTSATAASRETAASAAESGTCMIAPARRSFMLPSKAAGLFWYSASMTCSTPASWPAATCEAMPLSVSPRRTEYGSAPNGTAGARATAGPAAD